MRDELAGVRFGRASCRQSSTDNERVPQDMGGRVVVERGLLGDDGEDAASRAGRQASALGVEEERGTGAGAGPGSAFGEPLGL